ncbi:hypothetical protein [Actinosynnema sp. NPDC020468]|uniref:hypothetical protein n=1 Tax=Actinosynnema sp. NPDC020468 TaxID=3154488 RepID=UPI0033DBC98F
MELLAWLRSSVRRTGSRLVVCAVASVGLAVVVGVLGWAAADHRQDRLDDALDRQGQLTTAALAVYQAMADADTSSLNAVIVDPQRAVELRQRFRADVFAAAEALRVAATRSQDPDSLPTKQIRELTGMLPEYSRLAEAGWTNSDVRNPVGTSYLSAASSFVRIRILPLAGDLHARQTEALIQAQRDAGSPPWATFVVGAVLVVVLVLVQRFLTRRTRRRVNFGLAAATALTLVAVVSLGVVVQVVHGLCATGEREWDDLVAPLVKARNLAREADAAEARILIFPKVGDIGALGHTLDEIEHEIDAAGADPTATRRALDAVRSWREQDRRLLAQADPATQGAPPVFTEVAGMIAQVPQGQPSTYPQQLDAVLNDLIEAHSAAAGTAVRDARATLAHWDGAVLLLMVAAAAAAMLGMRPRMREYRQ